MKRLSGALGALVAFVLMIAVAGATAGGRTVTDGASAAPSIDTGSAIVQLNGDPLSTYVKTKPAHGKKIDFSNTSVKSYRAQLNNLRNDFKAWLRSNAPSANVVGEYDISLNAVAVRLNGTPLGTIASAPLVKSAQYEGLYTPQVTDPDLALINAVQAWNAAGGAANAGAGVKVAIVDTGIDITHPCFSDAGYPAQNQLGNRSFTNNKVVVAKVFNNKAGNKGYSAEAVQEHGTHVAGTVACDYLTPATVSGVTIPYDMSGVAPRALLGNYNVFPGDVTNARSEDILNALDAAYADGFDVANMSLGGTHGKSGNVGGADLLTTAVNDLDQANMVVAVAAGNSGPGHYTVESPGSAERALTAGASTVPHFVGAPVTVGGNSYGAAAGDFATVAVDLTAPLGVVAGATAGSLGTACSALPANSLTGKIALISRGTCTFSIKIRNAQNAGASAVLVVNNVAGDPTAMGQDGTANQPTVPAYMLSLANKATFIAAAGQSTTIGAANAYFLTSNANIMAGFSSQGPTDVDFRVKPDVVAPGVNVLSSIPHQFCLTPPCFAFFQGTSMATPHLAGSAAVVVGQHPDWSAAEVRSAIVNTATQGVLKDFQTGASVVVDPNIVGAGLDNLEAAVGATVGIDPVSVSFGAVPRISDISKSVDVTLSNLTGSAQTYALSIGSVSGSGVSYSTSASSVTIDAGGSATVSIKMTAAKGAGLGDHYATLQVGSSHAILYTFIK
ncbi:MAG: S8 family serine peptidase [Gaiellaceae bacterium]